MVEIEEKKERIIRVRSSDGQWFNVSLDVMKQSACVNEIVKDLGPDEEPRYPVKLPNIDSALLKKLLRWCEHHIGDPLPPADPFAHLTPIQTHQGSGNSQKDQEFIVITSQGPMVCGKDDGNSQPEQIYRPPKELAQWDKDFFNLKKLTERSVLREFFCVIAAASILEIRGLERSGSLALGHLVKEKEADQIENILYINVGSQCSQERDKIDEQFDRIEELQKKLKNLTEGKVIPGNKKSSKDAAEKNKKK